MTDQRTRTLKELVQIARDSADFYESARDEVRNPALKDIFTRMAAAKRELIDTLGARLALTAQDIPEHGTLTGNLRKMWTDMRASFSDNEEAVYVGQLEEAEDRMLEHFNEALHNVDDVHVRETLAAQLPKVRACHDEMRDLKRQMSNESRLSTSAATAQRRTQPGSNPDERGSHRR